jgi:hypothetical protein
MRRENRSDALTVKLEFLAEKHSWAVVKRVAQMIDDCVKRVKVIPLATVMSYKDTKEMLTSKQRLRLSALQGLQADARLQRDELSRTAASILSLRKRLKVKGNDSKCTHGLQWGQERLVVSTARLQIQSRY